VLGKIWQRGKAEI